MTQFSKDDFSPKILRRTWNFIDDRSSLKIERNLLFLHSTRKGFSANLIDRQILSAEFLQHFLVTTDFCQQFFGEKIYFVSAENRWKSICKNVQFSDIEFSNKNKFSFSDLSLRAMNLVLFVVRDRTPFSLRRSDRDNSEENSNRKITDRVFLRLEQMSNKIETRPFASQLDFFKVLLWRLSTKNNE